jgi:hypothetical protein
MQMQMMQMTKQTMGGTAMQTTEDDTDNYAAMQTTFIDNIADYNADTDDAHNFADNG